MFGRITHLQLKLTDYLWSNANISRYFYIGPKNKIISDYQKPFREDVFNDNPHKALHIILSNPNLKKLTKPRIVYLACRSGDFDTATKYLESIPKDNAEILLQYIKLTKKPFTPSKTLLDITRKHGVHPHFGELETLIRKYHLKSGAEIGVFMGYHASHLLESCQTLQLYCVDVYRVIGKNGYQDWTNQDFEALFQKVSRKLQKYKRVIFVRKLSKDAAKDFKKGSLDYVFIDADHRYQGVKSDLALWEPIVRKGGIIAGHDYNHPQWQGVKKAVDEWALEKKRKINLGNETFWWTIK